MPAPDRIVVFVHGWSVRSTETYGELPARLKREAAKSGGPAIDARHLFLARYVSFRDEVHLEDVARAFEAALREELGAELKAGRRFACITHSTGGPVAREWWHRHHGEGAKACPMSHLIMLAPPNFGCALAQLGKSRLSRIKTWFEGVEPGTGLLDWLELGSPEAWERNRRWIESADPARGRSPVYSFVLTGESIDRSLYDHLNSYTDEDGSDGVVRSSAANLNAACVRLVQEPPPLDRSRKPTLLTLQGKPVAAPRTSFGIVAGRSHSGKEMGILRSVRDVADEHPTVAAVLRCLEVESAAGYRAACDWFDEQNEVVIEKQRLEVQKRRFLPDRTFEHQPQAMVIVRIRDDSGHSVPDFDLKLTAGRGGRVSPDLLPEGFLTDRQKNRRDAGTITFYFNHAAMSRAESLGMELTARPDGGFVHFLPATLQASKEMLATLLRPRQTTMVEIVLRRVVRQGTFRLTRDLRPADFTHQPEGAVIP